MNSHRKKIWFLVLSVMSLYSAMGAATLCAVVLAARVGPEVIHWDYSSISATSKMREALHEIQEKKALSADSLKKFDSALSNETEEISSEQERITVKELRRDWQASRVGYASFQKNRPNLTRELDDLVRINEDQMNSVAYRARDIADRLFAILVVFYVAAAIYSAWVGSKISRLCTGE